MLNWVLVNLGPALQRTPTDREQRAAHDDLVRAIHDAIAIADDGERERLAKRVMDDLAILP